MNNSQSPQAAFAALNKTAAQNCLKAMRIPPTEERYAELRKALKEISEYKSDRNTARSNTALFFLESMHKIEQETDAYYRAPNTPQKAGMRRDLRRLGSELVKLAKEENSGVEKKLSAQESLLRSTRKNNAKDLTKTLMGACAGAICTTITTYKIISSGFWPNALALVPSLFLLASMTGQYLKARDAGEVVRCSQKVLDARSLKIQTSNQLEMLRCFQDIHSEIFEPAANQNSRPALDASKRDKSPRFVV